MSSLIATIFNSFYEIFVTRNILHLPATHSESCKSITLGSACKIVFTSTANLITLIGLDESLEIMLKDLFSLPSIPSVIHEE